MSSKIPESVEKDAGATGTRKVDSSDRNVVVLDCSSGCRESSCNDYNRNTNSTSNGSSTGSSDISNESGNGDGDSGVVDVDGVSGASCRVGRRVGSSRIIIKGPVEGSTDSRVATRVHPGWRTDAGGVSPSASSQRGCFAAENTPDLKPVAAGVTRRNCQPMGANLTKQSRVSLFKDELIGCNLPNKSPVFIVCDKQNSQE